MYRFFALVLNCLMFFSGSFFLTFRATSVHLRCPWSTEEGYLSLDTVPQDYMLHPFIYPVPSLQIYIFKISWESFLKPWKSSGYCDSGAEVFLAPEGAIVWAGQRFFFHPNNNNLFDARWLTTENFWAGFWFSVFWVKSPENLVFFLIFFFLSFTVFHHA